MQLSTVKISNIFSFPYIKNLTEVEGVKFHNSENGVINIIIGPNGSGKSNLLEIVHIMRKYGVTVDYTREKQEDSGNLLPKIKLFKQDRDIFFSKIKKHRSFSDYPSHVYFSVLLTQHDMDNLCFLNKNANIINNIIEKYSDLKIRFQSVTTHQLILYNKIHFYFTIDDNNKQIVLHRHNIDTITSFIYDYFQHFEIIQICMTIYNNDYKQQKERKRYPLHNTFAIITSQFRTGQNEDIKHPKPIRLFLKKYLSTIATKTLSEQSLFKKFFLESLNLTLKKYTGLQIQYDKRENNVLFADEHGYLLYYHELSSGEQSFVSIILSLYSHDLLNGLMIIDEPEIHLHPQSQELLIELLEDMKNRQKMQFIIATHAPSMINEHNINNVFRCSKEKNNSTIISPSNTISEDDATLLQMLKFDHIAKIFFVNTIILVEGETDMYFFSHYLNYLKTQEHRNNSIKNYEIITIGGKGGCKRRKKFLTKFNINSYYIGDRDNIIEYGIVNNIEKTHSHRQDQINSSGSKYEKVITQMKEKNLEQYLTIRKKIKNLYQKKTYLLMEGDLESYLGLPAKGLNDTVYFCQNVFYTRLANKQYDKKREELNNIIKDIFRL